MTCWGSPPGRLACGLCWLVSHPAFVAAAGSQQTPLGTSLGASAMGRVLRKRPAAAKRPAACGDLGGSSWKPCPVKALLAIAVPAQCKARLSGWFPAAGRYSGEWGGRGHSGHGWAGVNSWPPPRCVFLHHVPLPLSPLAPPTSSAAAPRPCARPGNELCKHVAGISMDRVTPRTSCYAWSTP